VLLEAAAARAEEGDAGEGVAERARVVLRAAAHAVVDVDEEAVCRRGAPGDTGDVLEEAIVADTRYGATEKERALFHVIEIHASSRKWQPVIAAAEQFQTALKLDPFDPSVTYSVGLCHYLNRDPEKALPYLKKAVGQDPNLLEAREQLGRVLVMQGQHAEAIPELEAALPLDNDGSLHYLLSVCYRKLEQPEKAKGALEASEQIRARNRELVESKVGEPSPP